MLENPSSIAIATLVLGLVTGILSGAFGIGGGVIVVPALVLLFGMAQKTAQGMSLALMVPMALLSAFQYWRFGHLQVSVSRLALLCAGALGGALIGSLLADRLPAGVLRRLFAVLVILIAVRMLWPEAKPAAQGTPPPETR